MLRRLAAEAGLLRFIDLFKNKDEFKLSGMADVFEPVDKSTNEAEIRLAAVAPLLGVIEVDDDDDEVDDRY